MSLGNNIQVNNASPLIILASLVIIVAAMKMASPILNPLFLSIFIAIVCWPILLWLGRKGVPSGLAVTLVILGLFIVLIGFGAYVASAAHQFSREISTYQANLQGEMTAIVNWLIEKGITIPNEKDIIKELNAGKIMKFIGNLVSGVGNLFADVFFILLTVFFLLLESYVLPAKVRSAFGDSSVNDHTDKILSSVKRYLAIKMLTSLATALLITVWLIFLGVDFPVLWGVIAFMLNFVPNIGSIIAAVPTVLLALVQLGGGSALLVATGYLVVNTLVGNVWEPRIMGKGLGLSTLVVFLSLIFWGWVFGAIGMFLSVPFTMIAKIFLENDEKTQWIAILLGSEDDLNVQVENKSDLEAVRE